MRESLSRRVVSEGIGTAFLVAAIIGSGIMGDRLANRSGALALLANTVATGAALLRSTYWSGWRSGHCTPDVWIAADFYLASQPERRRTGIQRVCCNVRLDGRDLGMRSTALDGRAFRRCGLHHSRVLVHGFNIVCKSCGYHWKIIERYVFRNQPS